MATYHDQNNKLFILGIICLVLCIALVLFSVFIIPYLIWSLNYNVPETVLAFIAYFEDNYYFTEPASRLIVWLLFFIPGLIAGFLSYIISYKIDNKVLGLETEKEETEEESIQRTDRIKKDLRESAGLGLKILILMLLILGLFLLVQIVI